MNNTVVEYDSKELLRLKQLKDKALKDQNTTTIQELNSKVNSELIIAKNKCFKVFEGLHKDLMVLNPFQNLVVDVTKFFNMNRMYEYKLHIECGADLKKVYLVEDETLFCLEKKNEFIERLSKQKLSQEVQDNLIIALNQTYRPSIEKYSLLENTDYSTGEFKEIPYDLLLDMIPHIQAIKNSVAEEFKKEITKTIRTIEEYTETMTILKNFNKGE